ncbi:MAG TPA: STAS domain-containing protein [Bryobacteraceae bacterium]|nr:STAS domain-containing protein [Bryobacteraceae bacterium]
MSLKFDIRHVDSVAIIDLSGRITMGEAAGMLRDTIKELIAEDHKNILLNLENVSYIDSSGLGELVGAFATVGNRGGKLKLLHLQKRIKELMQVTKLLTIFDVYEDEGLAVRSFGKAATA